MWSYSLDVVQRLWTLPTLRHMYTHSVGMVIDDIVIIKLTGVNFAVVNYVPSVDAVHLHLVTGIIMRPQICTGI